MDSAKKSDDTGREIVLEIAKRLASLRHTDVLVRPRGGKDVNCDWVLEASGIGQLYFVYDSKVKACQTESVIVTVRKRTKKTGTAAGQSPSDGASSVGQKPA